MAEGFIAMAAETEFGATSLCTRINCLNSPWALDDITEIVAAAGDKRDVIMLPKVEGPWDIHYLDQLLAQLEARHRIARPIQIHAILETAEGVSNVEEIAAASGSSAEDVTDFINANLATGFAEPVQAGGGGLLGPLRGTR